MKLTLPEHGELIRNALLAGESYRHIAERLGCSKDTVSIFAKVNFPDLRRKPHVKAVLDPADERPMKILIIDIETRPNLGYVWSLWEQTVGLNELVESVEMISWAAKWLDDEIIRFKSVHHHGKEEMVKTAWNLLDKADVVMHYNGRNFDVPHLNREFLELGLDPPSPFKQIDLLNTVKRQFRFPSNKLQYVSEALLGEGKVEHEGFSLWVKCMAGDEDAWERMHEYNIVDVLLVEKLYYRVLPWIERHPSYGALTSADVCPNCGSEDLQSHGHTYTRTGKYQQYRCGGCGKYSRGVKRVDNTAITEVAAA